MTATARRQIAVMLALALAAVASAPEARADDRTVARTATTLLPRLESAALAAAAGHGGAVAVQRQYDAARDLQDALRAAGPASPACASLATALAAYARAQVTQAEGFDRLRPAQIVRAGATARDAHRRVGAARAGCVASSRTGTRALRPRRIDDPGSFEAFFGAVRTRAPAGAVSATVSFRGRVVARTAVAHGRVSAWIAGAPRRGDLAVTFLSAAGTVVGGARSRGVWLLPASAAVAVARRADDRAASAAIARLAGSFGGISAVSTVDLATGRAASWNDRARFPAASTVKLGVLAAALARFGPRPEERAAFADLRAITGWSSNLAANRLLVKLGGSSARGAAIAQAQLRRLGARSSTYTGNYLAGTSLAPREPPAVSRRVTTAHDLAAALTTLQAVATGRAQARAASGLSVHAARVALGLLLSSERAGDNLGVLAGALGPALPIAQKQGWLDDARLTAAIVYTPRGPRVVVVCAYAQDLSLARAAAFGRQLVALLRLR